MHPFLPNKRIKKTFLFLWLMEKESNMPVDALLVAGFAGLVVVLAVVRLAVALYQKD